MITTLKCDTDAVVAMICICCGFSGFVFSGYNTPNHADLAPAYAGTMFGITNMIATIPGFLAPQVNGSIIQGHEHEVSAWAPVWYIATGYWLVRFLLRFINNYLRMNVFGGLSYALLASGDEQPWASKKINFKYQMQFEINQFLFRKVDPDQIPILEGGESENENSEENPNFEQE